MDTYLPVDYLKSITKKRLIYKTSNALGFTYAISTFMFFVMLMLPVVLLTLGVFHIPIYVIILVGIYYITAVVNLLLFNFLVKIDGGSAEANKIHILKALSKHFKLENLDETAPNIIRDVRLYRTGKSGRSITCIIDNNIIYLNVVRLMHLNSMYLFSGIFMFYKCRRVATQFKQLQNEPLMPSL